MVPEANSAGLCRYHRSSHQSVSGAHSYTNAMENLHHPTYPEDSATCNSYWLPTNLHHAGSFTFARALYCPYLHLSDLQHSTFESPIIRPVCLPANWHHHCSAALISIIQQSTSLLKHEPYVSLFSFDFSKKKTLGKATATIIIMCIASHPMSAE